MVSDMHAEGHARWCSGSRRWSIPSNYDLEKGGDTYSGPSPNQEEGYTCNFYVDEGEEYPWWKGKGAAVDFFNPNAPRGGTSSRRQVLDAGIDGWKLDFGDSYIPTETR
jgi:alpha-glucosidase (family GH31 glycosyl hydrolase)